MMVMVMVIMCEYTEREELSKLTKTYDKTEDDLKAIQNVGQIIGEMLKQLSEDKCS